MEETILFNDLVLPTAWNIDDKSQFINIDSNGLKVNYTNPNDYKAVLIRANNPIPSQCGLFYFEVEITNKGKNGMIGVGYCTKQSDISIDDFMPGQGCIEDKENRENEEDKPWGCAYHGDDGQLFCSGSGKPYDKLYGPTYSAGDTIGCYLNLRNNDKMIFYTKNGVNLGIACYLPSNFDYLKNKLYPCIGLRSQDASVEANFGHNKFKYLTMTNDDIGKELWEACWINSKTFDQYVDKLKNSPNDTSALISRGKAYLIIGRYEEACEDLTGLIGSLIKEGEEDLTGLIRLLTKEKEDLTDLIRSRIKKEDLAGLIRLLMKEDDDDKKGEEEHEVGDEDEDKEDDDKKGEEEEIYGDYEEEDEENDGDEEEEEDLISSLIRWRTKKEDLSLIRLPIKEEEGEDKKKKEKEENDDHEKKKEEMIKKLEKSITNLIKLKKLLEIALKYRGEINYIVETYNELISDLHDLLTVKPDDAWAKEILGLFKELFEKEFGKWTSGNQDIDNFIQQMQLKAEFSKEIIEWIPFDKFTNIKYLAKGGFGIVFKAIWTDGYIQDWDSQNSKWMRNPQISVCLKSLNGSKDIKGEFLNEVENQHIHGGISAIAIYGITRNPEDGNYMMVMQYAKQGSLRKLLDNRYKDLSWRHKIFNLYHIVVGLVAIHNANLVHKDFHSGNIVNDNTYSSFITDFGLCRPVFQDSKSTEMFGVLPYIAPEVLYTKGIEYTQKSDIYSFGIIMSEVFTGYPPYHDIPHNGDLAIQVCLGRRPKIRCKVPQLLLDLMNECLDAEPQSRPTAKVLKDKLWKFCFDSNETVLYKQVEEIKDSGKNPSVYDQAKSTRINYQTHEQAIYTSRSLDFSKLPKPINAGSKLIDLDEAPYV